MLTQFEQVNTAHLDIIFSWLAEPHVMEFWDNTQAHKDDIVNFAEGRKAQSSYANGEYVYWIASLDNEPFAMLMTIQETHASPINAEKISHLSKTGNTYGLDYMIGNNSFVGKGYGAKTLSEFLVYFRRFYDSKADVFLIDPDDDNTKAKHVYMNAGFKHVGDFTMEGTVSGAGKVHHLLIKKFEPKIQILEASIDDYQCIQNMARFYVYDLSRECGSISSEWAIPKDGLYESFDFKEYFIDSSRKAYIVKVYEELAGFVLLNQECENSENTWNMGEFFIIAKFKGQGIGAQVAKEIWNMHPGKWEVSVIPNNKSALAFWEKCITQCTNSTFKKQIKIVSYDENCPERIIFEFDVNTHIETVIPTIDLARKIIAEQFPEYSDLQITDVEKQGHDNRTYRLGEEMVIRMPTTEDYAAKVKIEKALLPQLAKRLSIRIPAPIKMGKPSAYYPYPFSIYKWLPGKSINLLTLTTLEKEQLAFDLAKFLKELQAINDFDGPAPGQHNWWRGDHVSVYDQGAREQIAELAEIIDAAKALSLWDKACTTKWNKPPIWIHGDFAIGNMLIDQGKLSAIIDFGGTAVGDPACDLVIAWTYFSAKAREIFINEVQIDEDTWVRARAWALWKATFELCQIADKSSIEAKAQKQIIDEISLPSTR